MVRCAAREERREVPPGDGPGRRPSRPANKGTARVETRGGEERSLDGDIGLKGAMYIVYTYDYFLTFLFRWNVYLYASSRQINCNTYSKFEIIFLALIK